MRLSDSDSGVSDGVTAKYSWKYYLSSKTGMDFLVT